MSDVVCHIFKDHQNSVPELIQEFHVHMTEEN